MTYNHLGPVCPFDASGPKMAATETQNGGHGAPKWRTQGPKMAAMGPYNGLPEATIGRCCHGGCALVLFTALLWLPCPTMASWCGLGWYSASLGRHSITHVVSGKGKRTLC